MLAAEVARGGRMVRTQQAKYIVYPNDPVEQLFDWTTDPGETRNVAADARYARTLEEHRRLLKSWEARLQLAPNPTGRRPRAYFWPDPVAGL
jgi:arylsulfatase A-like enzyme